MFFIWLKNSAICKVKKSGKTCCSIKITNVATSFLSFAIKIYFLWSQSRAVALSLKVEAFLFTELFDSLEKSINAWNLWVSGSDSVGNPKSKHSAFETPSTPMEEQCISSTKCSKASAGLKRSPSYTE